MICYFFNNQIRYNKNNEFNIPFGKNRSSFNPSLRKKFKSFVDKLNKITYNEKCKRNKKGMVRNGKRN